MYLLLISFFSGPKDWFTRTTQAQAQAQAQAQEKGPVDRANGSISGSIRKRNAFLLLTLVLAWVAKQNALSDRKLKPCVDLSYKISSNCLNSPYNVSFVISILLKNL